MKRAWQVWLLYAVCLAVALPALGWLSVNAIRLEHAETDARARAEREEHIRLALWRMDTRLGPLVTQETARPHSDYLPMERAGASRETRTASPLIARPPEYVLLNFQIAGDGQWSSPQCPVGISLAKAQRLGATAASMEKSKSLLEMLKRDVDGGELLAQLPAESPAVAVVPPLESEDDPFDDPPPAPNQSSQASAPAKKVDRDYLRRQMTNSKVMRDVQQNRAFTASPAPMPTVTEGICRGVWMGSRLLLARRVTVGGNVLVQGSWLDWEKLSNELRAEVDDLFPRVELRPLQERTDTSYSHALATLPIELIAPPLVVALPELTPLRVSLLIAWSGLVVAALAIAALLWGVVALSQRREAFVSAVTHELRTPLTTLRIYAEMLDEDMVPGERQRREYLHTLRVEAERLSHLVQNVLSYARLERGRADAKRERVSFEQLWTRVEPRLADHAARGEMALAYESTGDASAILLWTDPSVVEQILFNLIDNASKYAARAALRTIHVQVAADARWVRIRVRDHGSGISPADARRLFRPFSKSAQQAANSAPGVGLGLALCRGLARQLGGDLRLEPMESEGASFCLTLPRAQTV